MTQGQILLQKVLQTGVVPEIARPDPHKVLAGDPVHRTWLLEDRDGLYCGLWEATVGKWRVSYDEWEYFRILSGHSIITNAAGVETHLHAGDSFIIRPGFQGSWEVVELTLKDFVIRL